MTRVKRRRKESDMPFKWDKTGKKFGRGSQPESKAGDVGLFLGQKWEDGEARRRVCPIFETRRRLSLQERSSLSGFCHQNLCSSCFRLHPFVWHDCCSSRDISSYSLMSEQKVRTAWLHLKKKPTERLKKHEASEGRLKNQNSFDDDRNDDGQTGNTTTSIWTEYQRL